MPNIDLTTMTPEELDDHRRAVAAEQERRARIEAGPARVGAALCDYLRASGRAVEDDEETLGKVAIDAVRNSHDAS